MILYLLIAVIIGSDGSPQAVMEAYPDLKSCQVDASKITDHLVSEHINRGSVTCQKVTIGEFA